MLLRKTIININKKIVSFVLLVMVVISIDSAFSIKARGKENITNEVKDILNNYYISDISQSTLNENSAIEIVNSLNDPYTQIINQNEYNSIISKTFDGIGVNIEMIENGARINFVMVNSPAMDVGFREGDIIVVVNNTYLRGLSLNDGLKVINGENGIKTEYKIIRKNDVMTFNLKPTKIYYPSVFYAALPNQIAYIRILSFGQNTLDEYNYIVKKLRSELINSYIVDLRNNTGGYIHSAIDIAGYYISKNKKSSPVVIAQIKNGTKFKLNTNIVNDQESKNTIFLVNKYTASAAEVLAACVQDYKTATVIGETTYGKGVAQSTFNLSDGSILKATTLKLYSPLGRDISKGGIVPDISFKSIDALTAGELLSLNMDVINVDSKIAKFIIGGRTYNVDMDRIGGDEYWEAFRQIISQASSLDFSKFPEQGSSKKKQALPIVQFAEVPKTEYKVGERTAFKINSPNYSGQVQYRAMIWDENAGKYINLWNTRDFFYDKWRPSGQSTFTIGFPLTKPGNYRIKIFAKRSGIDGSKGMLKGMNCDSYVYEIPFRVSA